MPSTPTTGVYFTGQEIQKILSLLQPPLELGSYEGTELGYNNRVYFISAVSGHEVVLKAGGRHWKRQKTEAEVAALLALNRLYRDVIAVPRLLGFSSRTAGDSLPHEWILLKKVQGKDVREVWGTFDAGQKVDVARKLGNIVVHMQSITPAMLGLEDTRPQYGNLSLTRPENDGTGLGHDHMSVDISPSSQQPLYISHILNGPPPSTTYLAYAHALLVSAIQSLETSAASFALRQNAEYLHRLRECAERLRADPPPILRNMDASLRWGPVFTHGDLKPQNVLVDARTEISVLDWEWCGFFPPHIEWDAGLNELVALLAASEACRGKKEFLDVLHRGGVNTPWNAQVAEWEAAMKLTRLIECVVPWWLDGYLDDGGETEEIRKEVTAKGNAVALELDELLVYFGA